MWIYAHKQTHIAKSVGKEERLLWSLQPVIRGYHVYQEATIGETLEHLTVSERLVHAWGEVLFKHT